MWGLPFLVTLLGVSLIPVPWTTAEVVHEYGLGNANSSIRFEPVEWLVSGTSPKDKLNHHLRLSVILKTRDVNGRVLSVDAAEYGEKLFSLTVDVKGGEFIFVIRNAAGKEIGKSDAILDDLSDNVKNAFSIDLNPFEGTFSIEHDKWDLRGELTEEFDIQGDLTLNVTVGADEYTKVDAITGCVFIGDLELGREKISLVVVAKISGIIEQGCLNPCHNVDCGHGTCVQVGLNPVCDCYEFASAGGSCEIDVTPVAFSDVNSLAVDPHRFDDQPQRIAIDIKPSASEGVDIDGVIFVADLVETDTKKAIGALKLSLVQHRVDLKLGSRTLIEFDNFHPVPQFQRFVVFIYYGDRTVELTVNDNIKKAAWGLPDLQGSLAFKNIRFGHQPETGEVGVEGCIREVFVDFENILYSHAEQLAEADVQECGADSVNSDEGGLIEVYPKPETEQGPPLEGNQGEPVAPPKEETESKCLPREETYCRNSVKCIKKGDNPQPICVCKENYFGTYCQYSYWPRNCHDALFFGEKEKGVYKLDVDGSGPLEMVYATCSDGNTTVTHNMPPGYPIRQPSENYNKFFPISYKTFVEKKALQMLVQRSLHCEQTAQYECHRAPLNFAFNATWFTSVASEDSIRQMGAEKNTCACQASHNCLNKMNCNCDNEEIPGLFDQGVFRDEHAGVDNIYVLKNHEESSGTGKLTLGPLKCWGEKGHSLRHTLTLKNEAASAETITWEGEKLEFEFRTNQENIASLLTAHKGSTWLRIQLKEGRKLELRTSADVKMPNSTEILSQSRLNDLRWHRVVVEMVLDELRFSVDKINSLMMLESAKDASDVLNGAILRFGNSSAVLGDPTATGFIGCIRNVWSEKQLASFDKAVVKDAYALGCPDLCANNMCMQEARCIEHFDTGRTTCECKNRFIHSGERCEKNINKDTEVSFHDKEDGFLKFRGDDLSSNPITSNIIFSFRTDQKAALLVYAHDQYNNFVQVHLADEYRIVLSLNNDSSILQCTVHSELGKEFSDMRWLQVVVETNDQRTTLAVNDELCSIEGPRHLSQSQIADYKNLDEDVVLPPMPAGPVNLQPFHVLFVGGVPAIQRRGVSFDKRRRHTSILQDRRILRHVKLGVYYVSRLPIILGCMRGFQLDSQLIDLRYGGIRPTDVDSIRIGCHNDCDSIKCHNSGHCTVQWQNYDPKRKELTTCDCSKTSYYGSSCLKDTGVTFRGDTALRFDMHDISKRFFLKESFEQTFQFSFAPVPKPKKAITLAVINFVDDSTLKVVLHKNGSVNVVVTNITGGPPEIKTFAGNFSDGYRHFFQSSFATTEPTEIFVDSEMKHLDRRAKNLHLSDAISFDFGPVENGLGYEGCMSNIDIDFQKDEKLHFKPLIYYNDEGSEYHASTFHLPAENPSLEKRRDKACPGFRIPGILPTQQRNVQFPETHPAPFGPKKYFLPVDATTSMPSKQDDGFPWLLLLIILGLLLLLILIVVIIVCCCRCCKKKKKPDQLPNENGEHIPLNPLDKNGGDLLQNNFDVPDPVTVVPRPQNQSPPMEMIDQDDDSDLSLAHYAEERTGLDDLNEFPRNSPKRYHSFRKNIDAPPGSPLNRSGNSPTPKKLVAAPTPMI
uniref:EGF-like domain-containing protein n=1 Tax=Steinernema glaseri TaxID=37863 RepID=A0A1I7YPB6_9BILA